MYLRVLVCLFIWTCDAQGNTQEEFLNWLKANPAEVAPSSTNSPSSALVSSSSAPTVNSTFTVTTTTSNNTATTTTTTTTITPTITPTVLGQAASMSTPLPTAAPSPLPTQRPTTPLPTTPPPTPQLTSAPVSQTLRPSSAQPTSQRPSTRQPTVPPTNAPTAEPTPAPVVQPRLQYRVRSQSFPDKCLTVKYRSLEDPFLDTCRPAVLFNNQSFTSIPQAPQYEGELIDPAAIQLVNGVVWAWTSAVGPSAPGQVRLTDVKVYGTGVSINTSKCASVPKMNEAETYPVYWFPCLVNAANIFILEPILADNYAQEPVTLPPSPPMTAEQLVSNAPYNTVPPGPQTPPPATCTPVMMQHIGRHGSRHATDPTQFAAATSLMVSAQRQNMLTPFGTELLRRSQQVVFNVRNVQLSNLMPQGQQEVYNYSTRMAKNFPTIFATADGNSTIVADSTDLERALSSRRQSLYALRDAGVNVSALVSSFAPSVCSTEYNILRAFEGCRESVLYTDDGVNYMPSSELKVKMMANATNHALDFYNRVFVEGFEIPRNVAENGRVYDRIKFVDDLWRYTCATGASWNSNDIATGVCNLIPSYLADLLAYSEDVVAYRTYGRYTPSAATYMQSCLLHQDVQSDFVDYVAGNRNKKARLRFSHRETILPYLSNMGYKTRDPYFLQDVDWKNREFNTLYVRMASNIQKVLYKCGTDANPSYYVKMLLNEIETVIPGCDSLYCPWEKYKQLAAGWVCDHNQFKRICNGLIVFCGTAREIALSKQANPNEGYAGPAPVGFGSSPFDRFGPLSATSHANARVGGGGAGKAEPPKNIPGRSGS